MSPIRLLLILAITLSFELGASARSWQPSSAASREDSLDVQLLFDGKPLLSKQHAKFRCFDYGHDKWINCRIRPGDGVQRYVMARPGQGRYRMHIDIDENEDNPDMYPGDFSVVHMLEVGPGFQGPLFIDVPQVIHLTSPANNGRSIEGAFAACDRDPDYTVPFLSLERTVPVAFSWDPVADGAEYSITVFRARCDPYRRLEPLTSSVVETTAVSIGLPPNEPGEHYQFVVEATRAGRPVGTFFIHDAGTHGWDYRLRVGLEEPSPRIAVIASLGAIFFFLLIAMAYMVRTGNKSMAVSGFVLVVVSGWLGYRAYASYRDDHRQAQQRLFESREEAAELQRNLNQLFVEEWTAAVPKPDWWDEVTPPDYPIDNVGELLSAWQSDFGMGATRVLREHEFFKGAYLAIVDHPEDQELTSTAIDLMAFIGRDYPQRREMLEFGVKHFFDLNRRTDNCADCMVGDRSNSLVEALG
ncbi:MAG: hypothetical protein WBW88_20090, partial [Rhodothermales bacterium]